MELTGERPPLLGRFSPNIMSNALTAPSLPLRLHWREPSILPGFGPAMGFTVAYLSLLVLIPLAALVARPWEHGLDGFWRTVTEPRVLAALRLSFGAALAAALVNCVMGLVVAWALVRYDFPGRAKGRSTAASARRLPGKS